MIFVNNLSPYLFKLNIGGHPVGLRWYGLAYALGFYFGYITLDRALKRGTLTNFTKQALDHLMYALIIGVLLGGRLGYTVQNLGSWAKDPFFPLEVWNGGMAFFGGLIGVAIGIAVVARKHKLRVLELADLVTMPTALGLAIGRIANFANAELWGRPTHANWGVIYPNVDNQPRHPSELYESFSHFLMFALLVLALRTWPKWWRLGTGRLSAAFLIIYGVLRFISDFWRDEPLVGPLNTGQYASAVVALVGFVCLGLAWRDRGLPSPGD